MQKKYILLCLLSATVLINGCANLKRSTRTFKNDSKGSISVWNAEMSAAINYKSDQFCMQRALAVKSLDTKSSINISKAILNLAETAKESDNKDKLVNITSSIKKTATLLTTSTERTSFLDIGLFYICQMAANEKLTKEQATQAIISIALASASLNSSQASDILKEINAEPSGSNVSGTPPEK